MKKVYPIMTKIGTGILASVLAFQFASCSNPMIDDAGEDKPNQSGTITEPVENAASKIGPMVIVLNASSQESYRAGSTSGLELMAIPVLFGEGERTYQWYKVEKDSDGNEVKTAIEGADSSKYFSVEASAGTYIYCVEVSNTDGSVKVFSENIKVSVLEAEENPDDNNNENQDDSISVTAPIAAITGSSTLKQNGDEGVLTVTTDIDNDTAKKGTLTYQWFKDGAELSGYTASSITVETDTAGTFKYSVEVTNTMYGKTAKSNIAEFEVTVEKSDIPALEKPEIKTQPVSASYTAGDAAKALTVEALNKDGTATGLTYQWYKDEKAIEGAVQSSYTPSTDKSAKYYVIVTNAQNGTRKSNIAEITVTAVVVKPVTPVISVNLQNTASFVKGGSITLFVSASASDNGNLSYQWYKDGTAVNGTNSASYKVESSGTYYVTVKNTNKENVSSETVTSVKCTVTETVNPEPVKPVISGIPSEKTISSGEKLILTAQASVSDGGLLSYQWYKGTSAISGENLNSYEITEAGTYFVRVTNTLKGKTCSADSVKCCVKVSESPVPVKPLITSDLPASKTIKAGEKLSVKASVSDGGTLSYQWYKGNTQIPDANSDELTVTEAGDYYVVIINKKDNQNSEAVTSKVCTVTLETLNDSGSGSISIDFN